MREIKFRAWDKVNKKMYPVTYLSLTDKRLTMFALPKKGNEPWEEMGVPGNQIELMQFTGLKDKNGKEIYEGDILVVWNNKDLDLTMILKSFGASEIYWDEGNACFAHKRKDGNYMMLTKNEMSKMEVIGNSFENPELLER